MTVHLVVGLGVAMWGLVFLLLLGAMAMEADVERRWNEAWAEQWEQAHGGSIDALIGRLARQVERWRLGRRLLNLYLLAGFALLAALAAYQYARRPLSPAEFEEAFLFGLALFGLLLLPLRAGAEIGLGLVEAMHRQVRLAVGERIVIEFKREIGRVPKPTKAPAKKADETPAK